MGQRGSLAFERQLGIVLPNPGRQKQSAARLPVALFSFIVPTVWALCLQVAQQQVVFWASAECVFIAHCTSHGGSRTAGAGGFNIGGDVSWCTTSNAVALYGGIGRRLELQCGKPGLVIVGLWVPTVDGTGIMGNPSPRQGMYLHVKSCSA